MRVKTQTIEKFNFLDNNNHYKKYLQMSINLCHNLTLVLLKKKTIRKHIEYIISLIFSLYQIVTS